MAYYYNNGGWQHGCIKKDCLTQIFGHKHSTYHRFLLSLVSLFLLFFCQFFLQAVRIKDASIIYKIEVGSEELKKWDSYGYTPLHYAAKSGYYNILQKLLEKKPRKS